MDVDENNNNNREHADALEFRPIAERAHHARGVPDVQHLNEAEARLLVLADDRMDRLVADVLGNRDELPRVRPIAIRMDGVDLDTEEDEDDWENQDEQAFNLDVPRESHVEARVAAAEAAAAAAHAARAADAARARIAALREENEQRYDSSCCALISAKNTKKTSKMPHFSKNPAHHFCRECPICDVSPMHRAVFACGKDFRKLTQKVAVD